MNKVKDQAYYGPANRVDDVWQSVDEATKDAADFVVRMTLCSNVMNAVCRVQGLIYWPLNGPTVRIQNDIVRGAVRQVKHE
ncbi:MAG: hypothetical protein LBT97_03155 [Planctomycetota bacterium]|jgi:hypothetical protein|nr:hypothetical protein [Planctomycetota bacterium]